MRVLGFNADLAPVADVWSNPDNTVIGDRAYSDDFAQAAELIPEAVRGFHSGGVATTLKATGMRWPIPMTALYMCRSPSNSCAGRNCCPFGRGLPPAAIW